MKRLLLIMILCICSALTYAEDAVTQYDLSSELVTKNILVPTKGYGDVAFTQGDIANMVGQRLASYSSMQKFYKFMYNEHVEGWTGVRGTKSPEGNFISLAYFGNHSIKPIGTNRTAYTEAKLPYYIQNNKMALTMPTKFAEVMSRGFSLFGPKPMDTSTNIKYDIQNAFDAIKENDTYCAVYTLKDSFQYNGKLDNLTSIIRNSNKYVNVFNGEKRDSLKYIITYMFPTLEPELYKQCIDNTGDDPVLIKPDYVAYQYKLEAYPYMAGYRITYELKIPYFVQGDGKLINSEVIEETKQIIRTTLK